MSNLVRVGVVIRPGLFERLGGPERVVRLLKNLAALRDPTWLVIDDGHELAPGVLRQLELLALRTPRELRFVLATRHDVRHEKILDAVLAGDDGLAQHRMRRHLQALTAWWH